MTNASFDPPTLQLLRRVLARVSEENPARDRFELADRILACAAEGERDPARLREAALRESG